MTDDERYDAQIEHRIGNLESRAGDIEKDVKSLNLWRAFVLGAVAPIAFLLGAFAHEIALFLKSHA